MNPSTRDYHSTIRKLTKIYDAQTKQLEGAYAKLDPVSWRKHPLSPLTPQFLSHLTTNLIHAHNGEYKRPRIIDLGCGAGEKTEKLRAFSLDVVGVDNIDKALRQARKLARRQLLDSTMKVVRADLKELPFEAESFDGAHDYLSFLHIMYDDWPKYVKSVHRTLKKGAPLLIVTFSGNDSDFYGYPVRDLSDRGIIFTDKHYLGDREKVSHLINSYFYFPKEKELRTAFKNYFDILEMVEIAHPLHKESSDHKDRKLWHILMRKY